MGHQTRFEYDGHNRIVEYIRGSDYGGGVGGILYTLRSNVPSYNHYNNRGDVVAKSDGVGAITYEAQYEAFGTRTSESGSTSDRQKANTKDEDPTGLLNEGFRYRDMESGTFITRDLLGFVDGPNLYAYVMQNPWSKFDPEGLKTLNEARENGHVTIADAQDVKLSKKEAEGILKKYNAPIWKPEDISNKTPQGWMQDFNPVSQINNLRRAYPGKTDNEVFELESARSNAARARYELVKNEGTRRDAQNVQLSMAMLSLTTEFSAIPFLAMRAPAGLLEGAAIRTSRVQATSAAKTIDPATVRFSQRSISRNFSAGGSVDDLAASLRSGVTRPGDIPAIRLVERDGQMFTLDNRRLEAFRRAETPIPYRMATPEEAAAEAWKFTTRNNGISIRVRGE